VEASRISGQLTRECRNDVSPRDGLPLTPGYIPGTPLFTGRDSTVGIVTRYGPDGPVIGSRCGEGDFPHPSRPDLGSTQPPIQWLPDRSGCKTAGTRLDHPLRPRLEVIESVQLFTYSPSGSSWRVLG